MAVYILCKDMKPSIVKIRYVLIKFEDDSGSVLSIISKNPIKIDEQAIRADITNLILHPAPMSFSTQVNIPRDEQPIRVVFEVLLVEYLILMVVHFCNNEFSRK